MTHAEEVARDAREIRIRSRKAQGLSLRKTTDPAIIGRIAAIFVAGRKPTG